MTDISSQASARYIQFYDSATWPGPPPSWEYGVKYFDGDYAADQNRTGDFTHQRFITVHGHYRSAGIIDFEPGNWSFNPWTLERFVRGRKALNVKAIVYCDRADASQALTYLAAVGLMDYPVWWISTLDNNRWTAAELAAELEAHWDAPIPADRIWANQWTQIGGNEGIDASDLFGPW